MPVKASVVEDDDNTERLDSALDELALEEGTFDPYSNASKGLMNLDDDENL